MGDSIKQLAGKPLPGSIGPDFAYPGEVVHGRRARCPDCHLSVHVYEMGLPSRCPYCGKPLIQSTTTFPVSEPVQPPSAEEVKARKHNLYNRPSKIASLLIAALAIGLLTMAVVMQINSAGNYYFQPLVSIYSLLTGLFVTSRFILAAFYVPPEDKGYRPTVSVLVPCFNEGGAISQTIERIFAAGYPQDKLDVILVNDGSKDESLEFALAAQTHHPRLTVVDFEKNRGLCHGWGVAMMLSQSEFMVCVDSDTFVFPGSLQKLMQGFVDPEVGGISGHCDVENANVNMLTRMQDVRYYFSYKVMKAAESIFGTVSCLPGCFSAYRRSCVLEVLSDWINATVFGAHGNYADDRSLTNRILKNYKILYDDEALATTIAPEGWGQYVRQQARWMRSYLREIGRAGSFMYKKHPAAALAWYAMMWLPIIEPVVMIFALVVDPIRAGEITPDYAFGVFSITLVWCLHFLVTTGRKWWYAGVLFTLTYIVFFSWQVYWALATLRGKHWGTRG